MRKLQKVFVYLVAFVFLFNSYAFAADLPEESKLITLSEAVELAIKHSNEVKIQKEVADKAWDQRERAVDNVTFIPAGVGGGAAPLAESAYAGLLQADLNYHMQRKEIENKTDKVILDVYEKYFQIKFLKNKIAALQKTMEEAQWNKNMSRVQLSVGMIASPAVSGIEAQYNDASAQLIGAQEELNKTYVEFNKLLGINADERFELKDPIPFKPLVVNNLDHDAEKAVTNSIDIWKAIQMITIERKDLSFLSKPYKVEEHDIDIAELNVAAAKSELRKQIRLLYYDIKSLEEAIKAAEEGVVAAKEALRVQELKFKVGMVNEGELLASEKALAMQENALNNLKLKHAVAVANYRNLIGKDIIA